VKKAGILNTELSALIASLGHTDLICIADAGLPIPQQVPRIDLALVCGVPTFLDTLWAVLKEIVVERAVVAREMVVRNASRYEAVKSLLGTIEIEEIPHEELKARVAGVRAVVRTGECTPYANILLQSGVAFGTPAPPP
jgi:D-ribose pyranase